MPARAAPAQHHTHTPAYAVYSHAKPSWMWVHFSANTLASVAYKSGGRAVRARHCTPGRWRRGSLNPVVFRGFGRLLSCCGACAVHLRWGYVIDFLNLCVFRAVAARKVQSAVSACFVFCFFWCWGVLFWVGFVMMFCFSGNLYSFRKENLRIILGNSVWFIYFFDFILKIINKHFILKKKLNIFISLYSLFRTTRFLDEKYDKIHIFVYIRSSILVIVKTNICYLKKILIVYY